MAALLICERKFAKEEAGVEEQQASLEGEYSLARSDCVSVVIF